MALIVEDGTGKADAESFASVAAFKSYFDNRGITYASLTPDTKIEQALRLATDFMEREFRLSWKGTRYTIVQALSWPRYDVTVTDAPGGYGAYPYIVPPNTVPREVVTACIILALKTVDGELDPDIDRVTLKEKVDVIEVEYDDNAPATKQYRSVGNMLAMYFIGQGSSAQASLTRC